MYIRHGLIFATYPKCDIRNSPLGIPSAPGLATSGLGHERPRAGPPSTSGAEGRPQEISTKADIGQRMSDVEGIAGLDQTAWNFA